MKCAGGRRALHYVGLRRRARLLLGAALRVPSALGVDAAVDILQRLTLELILGCDGCSRHTSAQELTSYYDDILVLQSSCA